MLLTTLGRPAGTVRIGQREVGGSAGSKHLWLEHPLVRTAAEHWAKKLAGARPPGETAWLQAAAADLWQRELTSDELQRFTAACRAPCRPVPRQPIYVTPCSVLTKPPELD